MGRYSNVNYDFKIGNDAVKKHRKFDTVFVPLVDDSLDDIYVITEAGDRLDLLAYQYYKDVEKWWIIAAANPNVDKGSLFLEAGLQLKIPRDPRTTESLLNNIDNIR